MVLTGLEEVEDFLKISWITNLRFKIIYNLHSIFGCSSQWFSEYQMSFRTEISSLFLDIASRALEGNASRM